MKIGIGVHTSEAVLAPIYFNHIAEVGSWIRRLHDVDFAFLGTSRVRTVDARGIIVREALKEGCGWWMSLDSDHVVSSDLLPFLWENREAAMVSALITKRGFPYTPVAFRFLGENDLQTVIIKPNIGVVEVDACAFGCTLVNLRKLQRLPKPWFFDNATGRSDLNLCRAFRKAGEKILIDTRVSVGHLMDPPVVWPTTADKHREEYIHVKG